MNGSEAQAVFARILIDRIREDVHPSTTHMTILEQSIPPDMLGQYLDVLFEKVIADPAPSIPMLKRIQRLTLSM